MRSDTSTVSIDAPASRVVDFLKDPRNLPKWAVGFAKSVRQTPTGWVVVTGGGEMAIRLDGEAATGIVDFWMSPAPGVEVLAASRVVPRGTAAEYVFTQFQAPGMPDEVFTKNVQTIKHELTVLKALLEVDCPL